MCVQVGPFNHGLPSQAVYAAFDLAGKGGVYRPWPGCHIYIAKMVRSTDAEEKAQRATKCLGLCEGQRCAGAVKS